MATVPPSVPLNTRSGHRAGVTWGGRKGLPKTFYLSSMPRLGALEMLVGLGLIGRLCKTTEPVQDPMGEAPSFLCRGT